MKTISRRFSLNQTNVFKYKCLLLLFLMPLFTSCIIPDDGGGPGPDNDVQFVLRAKYDSIRSYPEGGGVFIVYATSDKGFSGNVSLKLEADPALNATLTMRSIDCNKKAAEIIIKPGPGVELKTYKINLTGSYKGYESKIQLKVEVIQWTNGDNETPLSKLNEFKTWFAANKPEYLQAFDPADHFMYHTYPEILIVEHFTRLTDEFETRFCYHVMIAPHDWSMIRIRKLGSIEAEFAAKRESDGTIHSIPVSEYPLMLGY